MFAEHIEVARCGLVHVGKDLSPAAPLPYVDRCGVAHIRCTAVVHVDLLHYRSSVRLV